MDTLIDCAAADAEEVLGRSRLLSQEDKEEDIDFLQYHNTTRLQYMGHSDQNFNRKKEKNDNRKK